MHKKPYDPFKRKSEVQDISETFNEMLDAFKIRTKYNQANIIDSWKELMGEAIHRQTKELFFSNKKLFVRIVSASLKQELSMHKTMVLDKLNKHLGENMVEEVIFL
jgi:hypothetical protein